MEKYLYASEQGISDAMKLKKYFNLVHKKHIDAYGKTGADNIVENIEETYRQIHFQLASPEKNNNVLLVGKVQSGKTSNLELLTAIAFDNGYNILVIYGGYDTSLLRQTTERFKSTFDVIGEVTYDDEGNAIWPKMIINYTSKTQCLFRISKGTLDILDDDTVNKKIETKRVEFHNMIYIGDGITDIPCMTLIKERHGLSIAVYKSGNSETAAPLVDDKRVDASVTADYRENSKLDKLVKAKIDLVALSNH